MNTTGLTPVTANAVALSLGRFVEGTAGKDDFETVFLEIQPLA